MALEDFFTLTELKDGLTSLDRVKELIAMLQKEKDWVVKNIFTVANIIAITESKNCLDLFVQSDGLRFVVKWLNDAQKLENDEELTTALLRALDRLQIDNHRLESSGIRTTVLSLLGHDNSVVRDKATALCDRWMQVQDTKTPNDEGTKPFGPATTNQEPLGPGDPPTFSKTDVREDTSDKDEAMVGSGGGALPESPDPKLYSGTESDGGADDAKKQVAVNVEKVESRERSCSTFEKISGGGTEGQKSPDSKNRKESQPIEGSAERDIAASQVSEVAEESEANTERGFSGFDLNQEVFSEEIDHPMDSDRLNIDLNVAEDNEDNIEDYTPQNKNPIISGLPSGEESSVEASSNRSARLHLDLNSLGDGSVDNIDGQVASLNQNGCPSPSQSSSSSSMRNIDLNMSDQSVIPNDVFSLLGHQVWMKQQDVVPQPNLRLLEPEINLDLGRSRAGWGPRSSAGMYGYNGFASGPSIYSPSPYGPLGAPIPYMVDPRGVPVAPQFAGSSSAHAPPPFMTNLAAGPYGAGPSQLNLSLNPGYMINGGNSMGLRRFFNNQGGSVDGRHLTGSQSLQASSSSVVGGKRQEPDSGLDAFPVNYKHQPPPWK